MEKYKKEVEDKQYEIKMPLLKKLPEYEPRTFKPKKLIRGWKLKDEASKEVYK